MKPTQDTQYTQSCETPINKATWGYRGEGLTMEEFLEREKNASTGEFIRGELIDGKVVFPFGETNAYSVKPEDLISLSDDECDDADNSE